MSNSLQNIYEKIGARRRITLEEATRLYHEADLLRLGEMAGQIAREKNACDIGFCIDRNINYSNLCAISCQFCNFSRKKDDPDVYTLSRDQIYQKIKETLEHGGTGILLQGGLHPDFKIDWYEALIDHIHSSYPELDIHAFSPPEIEHISRLSRISYEETLSRLKSVGLHSVPGGGGEILVDRVRKIISKGKVDATRWLEIMKIAHRLGLPSSATMMFGHIETIQERLLHLDQLRQAQDETGGFFAFIPWTFQSEGTQLNTKHSIDPVSAHDYLRLLAIARIYLDNFKNIQVSWLTQGLKVASVALHFGANDLGSAMIEENVIRQAGAKNKASGRLLRDTIEKAGFRARQRNACYQFVE